LLAGLNRAIGQQVASWLSMAAAGVVAAACAELMRISSPDPIVYWFGGWQPHGGIAPGISFVIDPMGAGLALLASLLVVAALIFSSRYFDTVGTLYHVLILVFLAATCGFTLTGDLFDLFVFFELMSVTAYALCGYKSEEPGPLAGAMNFAVVNTIGGFLVFCGIGLVYGRTGALNMAQIGQSLSGGSDGLVVTAFILIAAGFLTKSAVVPFHFWLADAHAVAPTPVCMLFSGVMVELGLYAVARVYWTIFAGPLGAHSEAVRHLFAGLGALTAILGAIMCFAQRNIKRLLAFSTISHVGIMLLGIALLTNDALAGTAIYVAGHALVKGALFAGAGILLHRFQTVDEFELYGRARKLGVTGFVFLAGGLALAGAPPGGMLLGDGMIDQSADGLGFPWVRAVSVWTAVLTGGAVLRFTGRVFAGWGPRIDQQPEGGRQIREKPETHGGHGSVPAVMWVPALLMVLAGFLLTGSGGFELSARGAAAHFEAHPQYIARVLDGAREPALHLSEEPASVAQGFLTAGGAVLLALFVLFRRSHRRSPGMDVLRALRTLHSGVVNDYVTWLVAGVAAMGAVAAVTFR
jgi:multicomponent Na+:H+ antiporter subunit D